MEKWENSESTPLAADAGGLYRAKPHYILREIAGESILVSVGDGVADFCGIIRLNASAKAIWTALQSGATEAALVQALMDAFGIPEERAREDTEKALALLTERKMIDRA